MLSQKKVFTSGLVLLLIIAAMALSSYLQAQLDNSVNTPFFPSLTLGEITSLTLSRGDSGVRIFKDKESVWMLSPLSNPTVQYRADSVKVVGIIDKSIIMAKVRKVTSDLSQRSAFDLTPEKGVQVSLFDNNKTSLASFTVGKKAQNWRYTYLLQEGTKDIYEASGSISYAFKAEMTELRDNTIPLFNADLVQKMVIKGDSLESVITLNKSDKGWDITTFPDTPFFPEDAPVQRFFKQFSPFTVAAWDYSKITPSDAGFDAPTLQFYVEQVDGKSINFSIGKKEADLPRYYFRASTLEETALIYNARVEGLLHEIKRLME